MSATAIEWTDATWNPLAGCAAVSPGCAHCYAATMTRRLDAMGQADYAGLTTAKHFNGIVRPLPGKLAEPFKWKRPRRVFVNSMSDLFHDDVPAAFVDQVFATMALAHQHTFQILTKRPERMRKYMSAARAECVAIAVEKIEHRAAAHTAFLIRYGLTLDGVTTTPRWPLPNVWIGTSVENQAAADERIPHLLATPATIRFLSCEPLLGPVDLRRTIAGIHWVIAGGESGHHARPCHPNWLRELRDDCKTAGVAFFFKQWGESRPADQGPPVPFDAKMIPIHPSGRPYAKGEKIPLGHGIAIVHRVGKKSAGRQLDGREWNEWPQVPSP